MWLENRHIIRAIDAWATCLWEESKEQEALEIFRKLLNSDPNDNIGVRYSILAIRLGFDPDYEMEFEMKDMPGYMDASQVMDWFEKESKNFLMNLNGGKKRCKNENKFAPLLKST